MKKSIVDLFQEIDWKAFEEALSFIRRSKIKVQERNFQYRH